MPQDLPTKEQIFRKSIHLFADDGYESVSMRDIATACGIKASSIYNHYKNKEDILAHIYAHFLQHQNDCRPTPAQYLPILKHGTAVEILEIFNYPMADEQDPEPLMFDIIRILWSRIHIDPGARQLYRQHVMEAACQYINEVMHCGIALGRITMQPDDVDTFASLVLAARNYVASAIPLYPDVSKWKGTSAAMLHMLAGTLVMAPPANGG